METKIESKVGTIKGSSEKVYLFLSDFNNFTSLIPQDKVKNWQASKNHCSFAVEGLGNVGLKIIEEQPFELIKITGEEGSKFDFFFWIQLKDLGDEHTALKLTIKAELNPFLKMMAVKPLQTFVDMLVDQIGKMSFP